MWALVLHCLICSVVMVTRKMQRRSVSGGEGKRDCEQKFSMQRQRSQTAGMGEASLASFPQCKEYQKFCMLERSMAF